MASVQVYNDGNRYRGFSSSNGDDEQGEKQAFHLSGVQVFVEGHEIDVHTVQDQLYGHQQRDQVPAREQPVHADKEKGNAYKKYIFQWN